jgi:hypothetical protein
MTRKIALGIFLLALIFFLMPWVSVSCAGEDLIQVSGLDMVTGSYDVPSSDEFPSGSSESEPLAIGAMVAAAVGLIISLFTWKMGFILRILAGIAGIGLMIALKIKIGNDLGSQITSEMKGVIQINYLVGYWLTLVAFAAAAIVSAIKNEYTIKIEKTPETVEPGGGPPADKSPPA